MDNEDNIKCPHCGQITHIGGLIGEHTNDCPRCGKRALYPPTSDRCTHPADCWPFPTIDKPLTPLTPKEVKQYNKVKVQSLGDALL